jgi:uncharacterized membrane protein
MTAFTVWKFETPDGADRSVPVLQGAAADGIVTILDHAVVSWPPGAEHPEVRHAHEGPMRDIGWGAFWGALMGSLFLMPVLGAAAGAGLGALAGKSRGVGIGKDEIERIRAEVTEGTSALFAVTETADLDRLGERFHGWGGTLITTNLTDEERKILMETFGGDTPSYRAPS